MPPPRRASSFVGGSAPRTSRKASGIGGAPAIGEPEIRPDPRSREALARRGTRRIAATPVQEQIFRMRGPGIGELDEDTPEFVRQIAQQAPPERGPLNVETFRQHREAQARALATGQLFRVPGQAQAASAQLAGALQPARSTQGALTEQLLQASTGQVPSAAELQQQAGLERILRGQVAAAASARGVPPALALRQAQQAGEQASLEGLQQAAQLRAQEQMGARAQLAGLLEQTQRGQLAQAMFGQQAQQSEIAQQIQLQNLIRAQEQDPFARDMARQALLQQQAALEMQADTANLQFGTQVVGSALGAGGVLGAGFATR